jgi:hypothetical protein
MKLVAVGPVVISSRSMMAVGKLAQAVTQRLGAGGLLGIGVPLSWC